MEKTKERGDRMIRAMIAVDLMERVKEAGRLIERQGTQVTMEMIKTKVQVVNTIHTTFRAV